MHINAARSFPGLSWIMQISLMKRHNWMNLVIRLKRIFFSTKFIFWILVRCGDSPWIFVKLDGKSVASSRRMLRVFHHMSSFWPFVHPFPLLLAFHSFLPSLLFLFKAVLVSQLFLIAACKLRSNCSETHLKRRPSVLKNCSIIALKVLWKCSGMDSENFSRTPMTTC